MDDDRIREGLDLAADHIDVGDPNAALGGVHAARQRRRRRRHRRQLSSECLGRNPLVSPRPRWRAGTGFLAREGLEDLIIRPYDLLTALDGDKVMARVTGRFEGRDSASVVRVLERVKRNIVGVYHTSKTIAYVLPYARPEEGAHSRQAILRRNAIDDTEKDLAD